MDGINTAAMNMNDNYYRNDNKRFNTISPIERENKRNKKQNRFKPSPIKNSLRRRNKK